MLKKESQQAKYVTFPAYKCSVHELLTRNVDKILKQNMTGIQLAYFQSAAIKGLQNVQNDYF